MKINTKNFNKILTKPNPARYKKNLWPNGFLKEFKVGSTYENQLI